MMDQKQYFETEQSIPEDKKIKNLVNLSLLSFFHTENFFKECVEERTNSLPLNWYQEQITEEYLLDTLINFKKGLLESLKSEFMYITYPKHLFKELEKLNLSRQKLSTETLARLQHILSKREKITELTERIRPFFQEQRRNLKKSLSQFGLEIKNHWLFKVFEQEVDFSQLLEKPEKEWETKFAFSISSKPLLSSLIKNWNQLKKENFYTKALFLAWLKVKQILITEINTNKGQRTGSRISKEFSFLSSFSYRGRTEESFEIEQGFFLEKLQELINLVQQTIENKERNIIMKHVWYDTKELELKGAWKTIIHTNIEQEKIIKEITFRNNLRLIDSYFFCLDDNIDVCKDLLFTSEEKDLTEERYYWKRLLKRNEPNISPLLLKNLQNEAKFNLIDKLRTLWKNTTKIEVIVSHISGIIYQLKEELNSRFRIDDEQTIIDLKSTLRRYNYKEETNCLSLELKDINEKIFQRNKLFKKIVLEEGLEEFLACERTPPKDFFYYNNWEANLFGLSEPKETANFLLSKMEQVFSTYSTTLYSDYFKAVIFLATLDKELIVLRKAYVKEIGLYFLGDDYSVQQDFIKKANDFLDKKGKQYLWESQEYLRQQIIELQLNEELNQQGLQEVICIPRQN